MKRFFFFLSFSFLTTISMAQQWCVTENGLGSVQIGTNSKDVKNIKPLEEHPEGKKNFSTGNTEQFKYYYIDRSDMTIGDSCTIKYLFIVTDLNQTIVCLDIYVAGNPEQAAKEVIEALGEPHVMANSSTARSKLLWRDKTRIFFTQYHTSKPCRISITSLSVEASLGVQIYNQ